MSSFSLEQKLIQSIKNTLITAIKTSNLFKSLICCQLSFNLIQNYFHLADLLELSINKCLLLNDKRSKDLKSMAIYLIASNNQNINTIINDSNNSLYQECFIITLNHTPDHLANNLKSSKVASIIKGWIDNAEFNFNIFDSRSFHFNINHPSKLLYINQPLQDLDDHLDSYADKMMAVLTVLHQTPIIKYYDPFSTGTCLAARLAWRLQKKLDSMELPKVLPNDDKKNVDFIIIDRSSDPFSPLIHSYYYESSIHDLLNVDDFKRIGLNPDNPNENIMTLTENDQFYAKLRHTQVHQIHDEILKLINENPAAKAYFDSLNSQIPTKPNGDALASISGLMDQTLSIPEGQKIMEHKRLSDALASAIVNKQVALFAGLEQDISLNVATDPHKELQKLLLNDKIDVDDKLRLFLVYFIRYLFTKPEIIQAAQDQLGQVAVDGMEGIQVLFGKKPRPQNENHPEYRYTYKGWKSLNNIPKQASDEYEPVIGKIIEDILKNDGSPLVVPFKKTGSTDIDRTLSTLRGKGVVIPFSPQGFSATWGKLVPVDTQNMSGIDYLSHGRRTILFIIGGMTLSEIQAVHQLSTQYERSLIIGSTNIIKPVEFAKDLCELGQLKTKAVELPPIRTVIQQEKMRKAELEAKRIREEQERLENERRAEQQRILNERLKQEAIEQERLAKEAERLARETRVDDLFRELDEEPDFVYQSETVLQNRAPQPVLPPRTYHAPPQTAQELQNREALERRERERAEAKRLQDERERAEAKRLQDERQRAEAKRLHDERDRAEAKRLQDDRDRAEAKRLQDERERAEAKRLQDERDRAEAKRLQDERERAEAIRLQEERQRAESKRLQEERERAEVKRLQDERDRAEALKQEEARKLKERQDSEAKRLQEERLRAEEARKLKERQDAEAKRLQEERQRAEALKQEEARKLKERQDAEAKKLQDERQRQDAEAKRLKEEADRAEILKREEVRRLIKLDENDEGSRRDSRVEDLFKELDDEPDFEFENATPFQFQSTSNQNSNKGGSEFELAFQMKKDEMLRKQRLDNESANIASAIESSNQNQQAEKRHEDVQKLKQLEIEMKKKSEELKNRVLNERPETEIPPTLPEDELQSPAVPSSPEDKQKEMRRKQIEKMREIAREHKANLAAVKEKKLQSNTTAQNEYPNDGNTEPEVHMNVRNSVSSHLTQETVASFEIVNEGDKEVDFTTASFTKRYEMEEIDDARQRVPKLYVVNKDDESSSSRPVSGLPTKHSSILLKDDQVKGSAVPYVVPKRKVVPPPEHEPPQAFHPMQHQTSMPNQHVSEHEPPFKFHTVHEPPEPARRYESEHSYPSPGLIRKESDPRTMTESPGPYGNYTPSPGIARPVYQSLANYQSQSPTSPGRQSYQSLGSQNENVPDPYRKDIRTSYASLSTHEEHGGDRRTSYASLSPKSDAQSFTAPLRSPSPPSRVEFSQPAVQQRYPPRTHSAGQPAPQFRPVSHQYGPSNTVPPPRPQYAPYRQQAPQYANQPQPPVHLPSGSPPNRDPYLGPMNPNVRPYNGNGQYIPRPMGGTSPNFAGQGQMGRPMGGHSPNYPGSPPLGGTSPNYRVPPPMGPMGPPQQYRLPTQNQYPGPPPQNFNQHQGPPPQNFNQHPQNFNNQYPGNAPQNFGVRPNPGFDDHYDPSPIRVNPQNQRIPAPYPPGQLNSAIPAPHGHYPNDQFRPPNNYGPGQGPPNNFGPGQGPPRPFMPYRPAPPQQGFGHYPNQPYQPQRRPSDQR